MGKEGKVYWAELQSALSATGLKVVVDIPQQGYPWSGIINDKIFIMSIPPKDEKDGVRDFMIVTLFGQDEEEVVPKLSDFMGYKPFCRYQDKRLPEQATATLEWDRKDPAGRFKELEEGDDYFELQRLEEGFTVSDELNMGKFYQEFTPEIIQGWEIAAEENEHAEWNGQNIKLLMPFLKKAKPRIGKNQSLFGLSLISLDGKHGKEKEIVEYGLQPLIEAGILTATEAGNILTWYQLTEPSWDSGGSAGRFEKEFEVEGVGYRISTDAYRNCRDLNLNVK